MVRTKCFIEQTARAVSGETGQASKTWQVPEWHRKQVHSFKMDYNNIILKPCVQRTFFLAYTLTFLSDIPILILSGIVSDILSILSGILSGTLSDMYSEHTFWLLFWTFFLASVRVQARPTASGARDMAPIHWCPHYRRDGKGGERGDEEGKRRGRSCTFVKI